MNIIVILFFSFRIQVNCCVRISKRKKHIFIPKSKYSELLIKTLLAIKDKYFYEHNDINISSIGRAFLVNIMTGRIVQDGTTLT
ncbi:transglycosylase domain-containing protein [Buchnera aphidicola]|uniref:transglycosylase domain-containing protein n=1 Tax=Buchnera aphidicola TaxID=9 RepID=UPI0008FF1964|nr:transglycosylase domain-containing protein [Buchnera aphidicola]